METFISLHFLIIQELHNPLTNLMKNVLVDLPFSRKCESEADYIGLLLMARACYNPEESIKLWHRMSDMSAKEAIAISLLSTHPSNSARIEKLRSWLPEARKLFFASECQNELFYSFNKRSRDFI